MLEMPECRGTSWAKEPRDVSQGSRHTGRSFLQERGQAEGRHTKAGIVRTRMEPQKEGTRRRKLFLECREEFWEWWSDGQEATGREVSVGVGGVRGTAVHGQNVPPIEDVKKGISRVPAEVSDRWPRLVIQAPCAVSAKPLTVHG